MTAAASALAVAMRLAVAMLPVVVACMAGVPAATALARTDTSVQLRLADAPTSKGHASTGAKQAPSKPPIALGSTADAAEGVAAAGMSSASDPLVSNGLGSPLCRAGATEGDLSRASLGNCQSSGFEAAPAPTGNYAFDVHIDTGVGQVENDLATTFQSLLQLSWTVLVAVVHAVIVMLEWCYTIDLLNSSTMRGATRGLREGQATFTQPWLVLVLALASVLALYHGLVRRRVAETVGQVLMMLAMMVGGLWVIANPAGTVGALGGWVNEVGLGTLSAVAGGDPGHADRTLADSMRDVFAGAIEGPWCFMEFGDVAWCSDPKRLDPRLRTAGLGIAALEQAQVGCRIDTGPIDVGGLPACAPAGSAQARALSYSVEQLRAAHTNGEIFLALAANGPARNSLNDAGTLFNVLCGGNTEPCKGPTAAQAEFRTQHGTWWRCLGLCLIWAGALGMILTLGFIALHLFGAAISGLLYLLLAPAAVLAPALGDGGRAAFRGWATRLLGAMVSKVVYSLLLGVVLLMERIFTTDLTALGWLTQWMLIATMWWGIFVQRHQVLQLAQGASAAPGVRGRQQALAGSVSGVLQTPRSLARSAGVVKDRLFRPAPSVEQRRRRTQAGREQTGIAMDVHREQARIGMDAQVRRTLEREHLDATAQSEMAPEAQTRTSVKRAQLERVRAAHDRALGGSEGRRAIMLRHRSQRIEGEIEREQQTLNTARRLAGDGERARRATGRVYTREQAEERGRFLDAQAALPASAQRHPGSARTARDYPAMASLAGYSREQYERLEDRDKRSARLEIDRELALRRQLSATGQDVDAGSDGRAGRLEQHRAQTRFDGVLREGVREGARRPSASERSELDTWRRQGQANRGSAGKRESSKRESSVMRDAREVAAGRKRQLGSGRR
jgi:hypothetical protein